MKRIIINNPKTKLILTLVIIILTAVIGVSFAYFSIQVTGNENASSIRALSADLKITFADGPEINIGDIYPGWSKAKTFTVTNNGTDTAYYDIKLYDVYSTFVDDELVYTLTSTNGGGSKSETIMPNNDALVKAKIAIAPGVTQTFTMTIKFKELNKPQDANQTASFKGTVQIISPYTYTDGVTAQDITLKQRIFLDNEVYATNVRSKYATSSTGITYTKPSDYAYSGEYVYEETVSLTSTAAGNKAVGTSVTMDADSGMYTVGGTKVQSHTFSTDDIGKYTCNTNSYACTGGVVYKILEVTGTTVTKAERHVPKPNRTYWNGLGLYETNQKTYDNATTYFFRGHVVNNYVKFATYVWRIVRINEDGTIRMIRQTNYQSAKFHTSTNNKMYVGYMFGTTSDPYTNQNPSNMKNLLATFYTEKLASYSSYLADPYFCNDRTIQSIASNRTTYYYGGRKRLYSNKTPQFVCGDMSGNLAADEARDLFTMPGDARGNHLLGYPVGLITADELAYAGGVYNKLSKFYLNINASFSTMTPYYNTASACYMIYCTTGGYISYGNVTTSMNTRPVVNLKADVLTTGGSGSASDPYIVTN